MLDSSTQLDELEDLSMHEQMTIDRNSVKDELFRVLRVPGGYIYSVLDDNTEEVLTSVFVPLANR